MKAIVIGMMNHGDSLVGVRTLLKSIRDTGTELDPLIMDATIPSTMDRDIKRVTLVEGTKGTKWTWPKAPHEDGYDIGTGLYKRTYAVQHQSKVVSCMISHMRAWQHCVEMDEWIVVLEHDALFTRKFTVDMIKQPRGMMSKTPNQNGDFDMIPATGTFKNGIVGLNSPIGTTRKAKVFDGKLHNRPGIHITPSVDSIGDVPFPQGIAGNSAYLITPFAAKKLLKKVSEIGMWPNDAIMCKQLFPWLQVVYPYFTKVQGNVSSTTT